MPAEKWVDEGYSEPIQGSGRYESKDSKRAARLGDSDITAEHSGGPHINLEKLRPNSNPRKSGRPEVYENRHIYLR
jgi:hypothetical protein